MPPVSGLRNVILSGELPPASTSPDHRVWTYPLAAVSTLTCLILAPSFAPSTGMTGATTDIPPEDTVVMTRLQIAMSREFFGWPLYALVMAAGQVS